MSRDDDQRIAGILEAARELDAIVDSGRDTFNDSTVAQRAVERLLEIIGEASNTLSDEFKAAHPQIPWRDIAALRVLLAHHYHRVDRDQVWEIAIGSVPELRTFLERT